MKKPDYCTAKRFLRPIAFGVLCGTAASLLLLLLMSIVMGLWDIPLGLVPLVATGAFALGGFVSGYVGSRLARERGMLLGLICAGILFAILLLANLAGQGGTLGMQALSKLLVVMLAAAIGGVLGVNQRKNFKC